jgi:HlyD family secretion protein
LIIITGVIDRLALQSDEENQKNDNSMVSVSGTDNPFNVGFQLEVSGLSMPTSMRLLSGYSATASMILNQQKQVLSLPERVVHFKKEKPYVYIFDKEQKKKKVWISLGISDGTYVQIKDGLHLNQKVLDVTQSSDPMR